MKLVYRAYLLLLFIGVLSLGVSLNSQGQASDFGLPKPQTEPTDIITAYSALSVDKVQPGSAFHIAIVMGFAPGWHANANPAAEGFIPTEVILPETPDFTFGSIVYPKGEILPIESLGGEAPVYHDEAIIGVEAKLSADAQPRQMSLPLQLRYQACSDETCLLPKTINVDTPIEIVDMSQSVQPMNDAIFANIQFSPASNTTSPATSESGKFSQALSKGYFWAFLFVFIGGILTSLTPCVYPLIPITVSIFGASGATNRLKSFSLSATYVLGIALTYSILGVIAARTGAVFGNVMANPFVIIPISAILVALGLSMLGVFELRLPYAVQDKLNTVGGAGFPGAFAMGTVAGFIAAPCTGPALGAVLSYVATTGSAFLGFWLLLTYALGMGLLFIVIGTFSGIISSLPRSGGWMYVLENIFGVAIITVALYFLKDIIQPLGAFLKHSTTFFAIAGVLAALGVLLGKFTRRFRDLPRMVQLQKAFGILMAVVGLYMFVGGFTTAGSGGLNWVYDEAQGLELAKKQGKPAMLDFYATWCGACKELDHKTYSDPAVQERLSGFVNIKLDFSRNSDEAERLKKKYNIVGLPVVIFFDSQGNLLNEKRFEKYIGPQEFIAHIADIN
jgi:thiol:disulfide interchange protein DsbD